jgi:hypothetical protein
LGREYKQIYQNREMNMWCFVKDFSCWAFEANISVSKHDSIKLFNKPVNLDFIHLLIPQKMFIEPVVNT